MGISQELRQKNGGKKMENGSSMRKGMPEFQTADYTVYAAEKTEKFLQEETDITEKEAGHALRLCDLASLR